MNYDPRIIDTLFNHAKQGKPVARARVVAGLTHKKLKGLLWARNTLKTHPFQAKYGKNDRAVHFHAEVAVIAKSLKVLDIQDLCNAKLYIVRAREMRGTYTKRKELRGLWTTGLAKPCPGCQTCIEQFGIKQVFYTQDNVVSL